MQFLSKGMLLISILFWGCNVGSKNNESIQGTWQSLWQKDIKLQLQLKNNGRFQVTLTREGQIHNNLGWYSVKDSTFMIRDSVDYPLPICNTADTGRYTFRLKHDSLQFIMIDDKCEKRSAALQLERFVRISE